MCVVLAAAGIPGKCALATRSRASTTSVQDAAVFQAGTKLGAQGLETAGGRVLGVTASGPDLRERDSKQPTQRSRRSIFDGMHYRRDIGQKGPEALVQICIQYRGDVAQMDRAVAS